MGQNIEQHEEDDTKEMKQGYEIIKQPKGLIETFDGVHHLVYFVLFIEVH